MSMLDDDAADQTKDAVKRRQNEMAQERRERGEAQDGTEGDGLGGDEDGKEQGEEPVANLE